MCGIAGLLRPFVDTPADELEAIAWRMAARLRHRGPDDSGVWVDPTSGVALAHCRLAILDLSQQGHQPMKSGNGRYIVVYNGEIYNFPELRRELESLGHSFRSSSDTEIMLAAFVQFGVETAVKRFTGMFAFALWDRQTRTLHLARDRIGEKPLYYGWSNGTFLFSSELKALRVHSDWRLEVDRDALGLLLRHDYIPAPHSIYRGIKKLMPGTVLHLAAGDVQALRLPDPVAYWKLISVVEEGARNPFTGSEDEATARFEALLRDGVARQMVADVPLGAFLSGGIDSSTVVALMQAQSPRPVRTFTIGFHESSHNEAVHARAVAAHLGTDHTELYVSPNEALEVIPRLPTIYDEPFADPSQVPTFLVAQMARRQVTVSLSGDGGDELFAGYPRYTMACKLWRRIGRIPRAVRVAAASLLTGLEAETWEGGLGWVARLLGGKQWSGRVGDRIHKVADILAWTSLEDYYRRVVSRWKAPEQVISGSVELPSWPAEVTQVQTAGLMDRMQFWDMISYLPDDILVKVDRAAMAVSLETRIPLLDHRVVEFVWHLPQRFKRHGTETKRLLRRVLFKYVPKDLIERPKMGFGIPLDVWLRGPLREWAESLLNPHRLKREGFLNAELIATTWREHLSGSRHWHFYLWSVLMFQAWLEKQND
jgi:asparagine synthase (glutamine-hydrolysing)